MMTGMEVMLWVTTHGPDYKLLNYLKMGHARVQVHYHIIRGLYLRGRVDRRY